MPSFKNSSGGRTTTTGGKTWSRTTVRDSSGKVKTITETHGSYTHTKTYGSNGRVSTTYSKKK